MSKLARGMMKPRLARCFSLEATFFNLFPARDAPAPELAAKDLGSQEGKDPEKEKEENEKGDDRLDRVDQGAEKVLEGSPVPATRTCLNF